jgi:hypothetical protein
MLSWSPGRRLTAEDVFHLLDRPYDAKDATAPSKDSGGSYEQDLEGGLVNPVEVSRETTWLLVSVLSPTDSYTSDIDDAFFERHFGLDVCVKAEEQGIAFSAPRPQSDAGKLCPEKNKTGVIIDGDDRSGEGTVRRAEKGVLRM